MPTSQTKDIFAARERGEDVFCLACGASIVYVGLEALFELELGGETGGKMECYGRAFKSPNSLVICLVYSMSTHAVG